MKAHRFFSEGLENVQEDMERYSDLVGRKVKAIPTDTGCEEEIFTVAGLISRPYSTKAHCVLKSDECSLAVVVDLELIGKKRESYFYNPAYVLELE